MALITELKEEKLKDFDKEFHNLLRIIIKSGNIDQMYDLIDIILSHAMII